MLLADDCGSYGADLGVDLSGLLNHLKHFDVRILLNYIEPRELQLLYPNIDQAAFEKVDFIDMPIQSTSQRILKLMNRRYEVEDILSIAKDLKKDGLISTSDPGYMVFQARRGRSLEILSGWLSFLIPSSTFIIPIEKA
jgi:tRNA A37 methylthiotransferase MiaB